MRLLFSLMILVISGRPVLKIPEVRTGDEIHPEFSFGIRMNYPD
jgi:hypothetical protein